MIGSVFDWTGDVPRPDWVMTTREDWHVGATQYAGYGSAKISITDPLTAVLGRDTVKGLLEGEAELDGGAGRALACQWIEGVSGCLELPPERGLGHVGRAPRLCRDPSRTLEPGFKTATFKGALGT